ncbi:MAG: glutamine--fructose-6-phosphate transaminase (isomerizing) [Chloroflexi bacterium]|nr:glutamine--fructose-6-phosphate transaminase (isomerizing) [Chloroflexota bacterium]MCY3697756.1 glutamine--fructose-6-phosphate transaminase (isomerizing) [Chloroflexota bacterium]
MCGIVGYVGQQSAGPILLEGLQRLEYRGYDSSGIAVLDRDGALSVLKRQGKLRDLEAAIGVMPQGAAGIGHTRWATHGTPSDRNAHPHASSSGDVVVVHNGIVENYRSLKALLDAAKPERARSWQSETDTEVIPELIARELNQGRSFVEAMRACLGLLHGASAIAAFHRVDPSRIYAARKGSAGGIVIGYGDGEMYLASDLPALLPHTATVYHLEDGEIAVVDSQGAVVHRVNQPPLRPGSRQVDLDPVAVARGPYRHFMLKEIHEQPRALSDTIRGRARLDPPSALADEFELSDDQLRSVERVLVIGMGTSLHAAMIGRWWIEQIAGIPADFDNASEFRFRAPVIGPSTLVVSVTQSGETIDTLGAMDHVRDRWGAPQIVITNVEGSEATRKADASILLRCGPEVGVASTKTFVGSLAALYLLACRIGRARGVLDDGELTERLEQLLTAPSLVERGLELSTRCKEIASSYTGAANFLVLGRGIEHPIAMEAALKCKEISYVHAEGYAAGEMKHGPIALLDQQFPVIALATRGPLFDKMMSAIQQVSARQAPVIAIGDEGDAELAELADHYIGVPPANDLLTPFALTPVIQLLAYHIALARGLDIDQPRNLAKTVTVE